MINHQASIIDHQRLIIDDQPSIIDIHRATIAFRGPRLAGHAKPMRDSRAI